MTKYSRMRKSRGLCIRRYLGGNRTHLCLNAPNLATWLLSMVAGCIQPTLSSLSGEVTLCSCMNVKVSWLRAKFVLRWLSNSTNIFTRECLEFSFAVGVKVDLTLHSLVCRSFGFNAGRGHKSQVSLLSWRVCEIFNSQRTAEYVVINLPRELWRECRI